MDSRAGFWAVLAAAVLMLTGCGLTDAGEDPTEEPGTTEDTELTQPQRPGPSVVPEPERELLEEFYSQDVQWEDCEAGMHCTEITVPVDYTDPTGETIALAVIADGTDPSAEYVLTNPGGPGEPGYSLVAERLSGSVTDELAEEFNIVGFDPRGVDRSSGVECLEDEDYDQYRQSESEDTTEAQQQAEEIAAECADRTGELLGHVDTFSAARDMDIIRGVLGQDELHYVGFSYGTKLGMAYAEQFPDRVGRFVLDSMMDVSLDAHELAVTQTAGFESALTGFAQWCVTDQPNCIAETPDDVVGVVQQLFADVAEEPVTVQDGRVLTVSGLISGFIAPMYSPDGWQYLHEALVAAVETGEFYPFQYWADLQAGQEADGSYEWMSTWAFNAVMCLDYDWPDSAEEMEQEVEAISEEAPTFGPYMGHQGLLCHAWEHEPVGEPWTPDEDLPPMLFLATTGDPATPVQWAESMHQLVPASALIVDDAEGHIAYRPGNTCVTDVVDEYLLSGELPEGRTDC
ncbi:alpha/beta hydrolase [Nesterenkonia alba]|uniref:alpha/beta hydrolase n=1 Tax=Nesterenkonia alba TaxID=515814 RepID=UPI0003B47B12|nr:alpha/beta hydrolase [Nesterenkonia alba]